MMKLMDRFSLRSRIFSMLTALLFIILAGGFVMVWYTYRMERLLTSIIDEDITAYQTAEALESSLVNQKGFVSYYFLDGNPDWLKRLGAYRQIFTERFKEAQALPKGGPEEQIIGQLDFEYNRYITSKDQVIRHYKVGEYDAGAEIHQNVRNYFFKILDLCKKYKTIQIEKIMLAKAESRAYATKLRSIALMGVLVSFLLGMLMVFVLINQVLDPIKQLAKEANKGDDKKKSADEVKALSRNVKGLIENANHANIEIEQSREHLLQAEKMVMVGKLAAGTAHSIRNPLTSVKMRLFSLSRSLDLSLLQQEDFQVISEEVGHIDTIVQNFLEFSRPPKLNIQDISPSAVVDQTIQLLEHRLKAFDVKIEIDRKQLLPIIPGDPDQLKEVLVHLMINACESMKKSGIISILEEETFSQKMGRVIKIRLADNGPGIPESIRNKIFDPFFTTKENGSGLGLSIALRIIEEHHGRLDVTSRPNGGTVFSITLPIEVTT